MATATQKQLTSRSVLKLGFDAPHPDSLETGDILFPRRVSDLSSCYDPLAKSTASSSLLPLIKALQKYEANLSGGNKEETQISSPADLLKIMRIFKVEFNQLIPQWFGLSVDEFFGGITKFQSPHPLASLLQEGLGSDRSEGFFIGHCAMVVRNNQGRNREDVFVIEANITDFSHYGIAIHPYFVEEDEDAQDKDSNQGHDVSYPSNRMLGWVNRRRAMGERVWQKRHNFFNKSEDQTAKDQQKKLRMALVSQAKRLIGRSYGILDHSKYGHEGRLYCYEYIDDVYRKAAKEAGINGLASLTDNMTWDWMMGPQGLTPGSVFKSNLEGALKNKNADQSSIWDWIQQEPRKPFPLFTGHMLYRSASLLQSGFVPNKTDGTTEGDFIQ